MAFALPPLPRAHLHVAEHSKGRDGLGIPPA
jgi:hypothetical protein